MTTIMFHFDMIIEFSIPHFLKIVVGAFTFWAARNNLVPATINMNKKGAFKLNESDFKSWIKGEF